MQRIGKYTPEAFRQMLKSINADTAALTLLQLKAVEMDKRLTELQRATIREQIKRIETPKLIHYD